MKRRLVDILACPVCASRLELCVIAEEPEAVAAGEAVRSPACTSSCALHERALGAPDGFGPDCRACTGRDVAEGFLGCRACQALYPIIAGVPRLIRNAAEEYPQFHATHHAVMERLGRKGAALAASRAVFDKRSNESFSLQWERYQYEDKTWFKDDLGLRRGEFLQSMDLAGERLAGALILDAGCGNGRLTAAMAGFGCEVVGMDLSRSVERAHRHRAAIAGGRAPFVHFIQGNLLEPPLARAAFDHIHSSGVLHHTPDTEAAFRSILRLARPGAHVYVQLYRTRQAWVGIPNRLIRGVTSRLPVGLLFRLCHAAAPVHAALVRLVARLRGESTPIGKASRREQAVSLFDNYSPRYQYRYRPHEVAAMFRRAGLGEVKDVTLENEQRHMVAFVGTKEVADASTERSLGTAA